MFGFRLLSLLLAVWHCGWCVSLSLSLGVDNQSCPSDTRECETTTWSTGNNHTLCVCGLSCRSLCLVASLPLCVNHKRRSLTGRWRFWCCCISELRAVLVSSSMRRPVPRRPHHFACSFALLLLPLSSSLASSSLSSLLVLGSFPPLSPKRLVRHSDVMATTCRTATTDKRKMVQNSHGKSKDHHAPRGP